MAFSDIPEVEKCLQQIPTSVLNLSARAVIRPVLNHKDGCYIGEAALAAGVGTSIGNLRKVLGKLVKQGVITKDERYAHVGLRQRYRVNVRALQVLAGRSLSLETGSDSYPVPNAPVGSDKDIEPSHNVANAYPVGYPYRNDINNKNDKNGKDDRFSFITQDLPQDVKALIKYGSNISDELDNCVRLGIPLEAIKGALEGEDFSNAYKVGGLFINLLKGYKVGLKPTVKEVVEIKCNECELFCAWGKPLDEFRQGARCRHKSQGDLDNVRKMLKDLEQG
jgi:hypothetical protein